MKRKNTINDYVCPFCFQRVNRCECNLPPLQLIMIDSPLQDAIRTLNANGVRTVDCCAGHWGMAGQSLYISFVNPIPSAPLGFSCRGRVIRYVYTAKTKNEFIEQQKTALKNLYEWVKNFPKPIDN